MESTLFASQSIKLLHARTIPRLCFRRRARTHFIRTKCCSSSSSEESQKKKNSVRISKIPATLTIVWLGLAAPALAEVATEVLTEKENEQQEEKQEIRKTDPALAEVATEQQEEKQERRETEPALAGVATEQQDEKQERRETEPAHAEVATEQALAEVATEPVPAEVATEAKPKIKTKKKKKTMMPEERDKWTENLPFVEERVPYTDILKLKSEGKLKYIIKHPKSALREDPEVILLVLDDDRVVRTVLPLPTREDNFWKEWDKLGLDSIIMKAFTPVPPKPFIKPAICYTYELANIFWNIGLYFCGTGDFKELEMALKERIMEKKEQIMEKKEQIMEQIMKKKAQIMGEEQEEEEEDELLAAIRREKEMLKLREQAMWEVEAEKKKEKKMQRELEKQRRKEAQKMRKEEEKKRKKQEEEEEEKRRKQEEEEERLRDLEQAKIVEIEMGQFWYEMAKNQESRFFMGLFFFVVFYFTAVRSYKANRKDFDDRKRMLEVEDEEYLQWKESQIDAMNSMEDEEYMDREMHEAAEKNPQLQAGMQFLKSGAKMRRAKITGGRRRPPQFMEANLDVTFDDVAGLGEIKMELEEIVDFFRNREKYQRRGSKIPSGILLSGDPGTGKTLLAKAVAGEAGVNFFSVSASQFVEIFVGVGASRVRTLYNEARDNAPAVVFIDELDAVGRARGIVSGSGGQERDATVNQLLTCLDGFEGKGDVITIAATNRPDVLDPALVRPGRFDRKIQIPKPELDGRVEILKVHCRKKSMAHDVDYEAVARAAAGMVGAQLANVVDRASLYIWRAGRSEITTDDLLNAVEGEEGGVNIEPEFSIDMWRKIALNEAALVVASVNFPDLKNITMVTIFLRSGELKGRSRLSMDPSKFWIPSVSRQMMLDHITVQLAPRAADEIWHGPDQMCTIWADTADTARRAARELVIAGLSDKKELYGLYDCRYEAYQIHKIDVEALRILNMCYERAKKILQRNCRLLDVLVDELIAKKTLDKHEIFKLVDEYGQLDPVPPQPMDLRNTRLAEYRENMMKEERILTPK